MPKKYLKKLDIKLVKGEYQNPIKGKLRSPEQIYKVFKSLKDKAHETLIGVYLDKNLEIRVYDILSTGDEKVSIIESVHYLCKIILKFEKKLSLSCHQALIRTE